MSQNNNEYLDYWFEYTRYIPFPNTPNTTRKIGDWSLHSLVREPDIHSSRYDFYYRYDGNDTEIKTRFETAVKLKRTYNYNYYGATAILQTEFDGPMLYWQTINFSKRKTPKYCYAQDLIRNIESVLSDNSYAHRGLRFHSPELSTFFKLLEADGKHYRKIRGKEFKEKFGKTLEEFLAEKDSEKEMQKNIVYATLVGEAYVTIEKLRDECNAIMKGLQDGRHGYDIDTYKSFRNQIMGFNKYLGHRNEFVRNQIKQAGMRSQTLIMFLRDNAKKIKKNEKK